MEDREGQVAEPAGRDLLEAPRHPVKVMQAFQQAPVNTAVVAEARAVLAQPTESLCLAVTAAAARMRIQLG
jgi:hypothetical protein